MLRQAQHKFTIDDFGLGDLNEFRLWQCLNARVADHMET